MRKWFKWLKLIIIVMVAVVVVAIVAVNLLADSAVRVAVETAGTKALSVGVDVRKARLSILGGSLSLGGVAVNNPPGYQHDKLLTLAQGDVAPGGGYGEPHAVKLRHGVGCVVAAVEVVVQGITGGVH